VLLVCFQSYFTRLDWGKYPFYFAFLAMTKVQKGISKPIEMRLIIV
jgi:hypothetical protein